jgi:GNAT superfamily N-acetyltransferase
MDPRPTPRDAARRKTGATIRAVTPADAPAVWGLLREFAEFESMSHLATGDAQRMAAHLSGEAWPKVEGFLAEDGGEAVGYALYLGMFSSFWTAPMVWLEDLYVRESHRGTGVGRALIRAVAQVAVERGSPRLTWAVLDWNEDAIEFYRRLGATRQSEWHVYELEGDPLRSLVGGGAEGPKPGR